MAFACYTFVMIQTTNIKCELAKKILLIAEHYGKQNQYASKQMDEQTNVGTHQVAQMFCSNTSTLCEPLANQIITRHALYEYEAALKNYQPSKAEQPALSLLKHSMQNLQLSFALKIEPKNYTELAEKLLSFTKSTVTVEVSDANNLLKIYSVKSIMPLNSLEHDYLQSLNKAITSPIEQNIRRIAKPHITENNAPIPLGNGDYELHL
jgi:hypothetical protein